jgi:hypothetical protein
VEFTGRAIVVDVSSTGAKLSGANLPQIDHDVWIRVEMTDVLATVVWKQGDSCGVTFDTQLNPAQLHVLRAEGNCARFTRLSPEQRLAVEDWRTGLAR